MQSKYGQLVINPSLIATRYSFKYAGLFYTGLPYLILE